jgi:aminomethyltransferase
MNLRDSFAGRAAAPVPQGLIDGPFHPRLAALNHARAWYDWAGYAAPSVLDSVEFEYFALRNAASLFDISPMRKFRVTGPQAEAMLNRMVTRDVARLAPGRVAYVLWCDEEGMVIDDGTLFRFGPDDFRLCCQEPMFGWLEDAAWGFDCAVADETDALAALALQGPTSHAILKAAGLDLGDLRPFAHRAVAPGLTISRTGFTGDLGYELWAPWEAALPLWDRLWEAGRAHGLRAVGYAAVNIARIEAGFLTAGVDFQPVHAAERLHRGRTPRELGLERLVDFGKGHFNGRRALLAAEKRGPRSRLLRLDVEGHKPAQGALIYHGRRREAGHVTSGTWSPTAKRNIALAEVRAPWGTTKSGDLWAEIYTCEEGVWERRMVRARPQEAAFYRPARARATPPADF